MPAMDISATGIRARIGNQQGIAPLVSPAIARYIDEQHLYQSI
jgi:nicotinate-nucleotide adenylyltransferase